MEYTEDQKEFVEGVRDFIYNDFPRRDYITLQGPPGSGKSAVITNLGSEFKDINFLYCGYTGKCCDSLMTKGVPASTIYSAFYNVDRESVELSFNLKDKSDIPDCDVIVIDEVSMVPYKMFKEILSFGIKVIAVGDRDQLGPVKAPVNLILNNPDYELKTIHRQSETSGIIRLANEYNKTHVFPTYGKYSDDVEVIPVGKVTEEMILSVNQTICGTNSTRERWNSIIRKTHKHYDYFPERGERVICCKNSDIYIGNRRIINGTTGIVENVKCKGGNRLLITFKPDWADSSVTMKVNGENFVSGGKSYSSRNEYIFDFAYVITVNKAQGSEWDSVLYLVDNEIYGEAFYRNVNTGITRAKENLILAY